MYKGSPLLRALDNRHYEIVVKLLKRRVNFFDYWRHARIRNSLIGLAACDEPSVFTEVNWDLDKLSWFQDHQRNAVLESIAHNKNLTEYLFETSDLFRDFVTRPKIRGGKLYKKCLENYCFSRYDLGFFLLQDVHCDSFDKAALIFFRAKFREMLGKKASCHEKNDDMLIADNLSDYDEEEIEKIDEDEEI